MIDLVITATLRSELLKTTLNSHCKYLFKDRTKDLNLIMNVDCIGVDSLKEKQREIDNIFKIVDNCKFKSCDINVSNESHFGKAFYRCMEKTKSEFIFNLEEDWEMLSSVDFNRMLGLMMQFKNIVHLRLSSFTSTVLTLKNWNKFLFWNGFFFEVPEDLRGTIGWAGHPSLNNGDFIRSCLPYINPELNPEKQIKGRNYNLQEMINGSRFGSFHMQNQAPSIKDIGRTWMVKNGWKKSGNKSFFTEWEKEKK